MSIAIAVGLLTAAAVYLFMQRGMVRIVLGFVLASHAANLMLFAAGNTAFRGIPYIGSGEVGEQADPLPQAFVLTAIVIAFSITMFMVTLAITTTTDDDTENEEESPAKVLYGRRKPRPVGRRPTPAPRTASLTPVIPTTPRSRASARSPARSPWRRSRMTEGTSRERDAR